MIADHYAPFLPRPWFIGEMGFNGASASDITTQLTEMNECTSEGKGFLGSHMFQFQTAYEKTGSELNFGMFSLGGETLFEAGVVEGSTYDVRCLTSRLYAFDSDTSGCPACNHRAEAVSAAFGGTLSGTGLCLDMPPLGPGGGACTPLGQDPYQTGALVPGVVLGAKRRWWAQPTCVWHHRRPRLLRHYQRQRLLQDQPRRLQQRARQQAKIRGRLVRTLLAALEVRRCSWEQGPEHITCASLLPFSKWFSCRSYCLSSFLCIFHHMIATCLRSVWLKRVSLEGPCDGAHETVIGRTHRNTNKPPHAHTQRQRSHAYVHKHTRAQHTHTHTNRHAQTRYTHCTCVRTVPGHVVLDSQNAR